jgi:predicted acetylornithine/succinylornithine family transaminase
MRIKQKENHLFFHTYNRLPPEIECGDGVYLYDKKGKRYLDMFAGLAVNALGYSHPKILQAIHDQCDKYIHLSNYYRQEPQVRLAELLINTTNYSKVFFCNSGTEGIEGAIKIARKWGKAHGKNKIITFTNAYHGRTLGALSLMDREKYRAGYEPFLPNCKVIPFNSIDDLKKSIDDITAAVFLEYIQGEAGIIPADLEFINELQILRKKYQFLIVGDEIQSGIGRTGKFFSFKHYSGAPDIVVIAKSLGGGLPLGAILGNKLVKNVFQPGTHGSTFGGNPVACAAGSVVLDEILNNGIMRNAALTGKYFYKELLSLKDKYPSIILQIRGKGLMLGVELSCDCAPIRSALLERGILINCTGNNVLRIIPPLIITTDHVDAFIGQFDQVLTDKTPVKK